MEREMAIQEIIKLIEDHYNLGWLEWEELTEAIKDKIEREKAER